jgi:S-adenosylhomocysteine hydrolase
MKYTLKVELEVEIDLFEKDELDEEEQEEINDCVVETLTDNSYEITKSIFDATGQRTNVIIKNGFTFGEMIENDD